MRWFAMAVVLLVHLAAVALDGVVFSRIKAADGLSDNEVQHILQLPDGRMAITTVGNINIYDGSGFSYAHYDSDAELELPGYSGAYHVYAGAGSAVWIKMRGRLRCFDTASESYVADFDSLFKAEGVSDEAVNDLFVDSQKRLWTVHDSGVWDKARQSFVPLRSGAELQDVETAGGELLLFYSDGVLESFKLSDGRTTGVYPSYSDTGMYSATSLAVPGGDGYIYQIRTGNSGVSIFQRFSLSERRWEEIMRVPYVLHTLNVGQAGHAYITSAKGLWHVDCRTLECAVVPSIATSGGDIETTRFNTLFIDRQGGIWIGTYNAGVLYGHPDRLMMQTDTSVRLSGGHSAPGVNCRIVDRQGREWTGTPDGLHIVSADAEEMVLYTEDGLTNNNIKALLTDSTGAVWASTGNGINSVRLHDNGSAEVRAYGIGRGALADEYYAGAACTLPDGRLLFSGSGGSTVFSPYARSCEQQLLPAPLFRDVQAGGRIYLPADTTGLLTLPYDTDGVSFNAVSMNYANPERTRFEMRIVVDGDSVHSGFVPQKTLSDGMIHVSLVNPAPGYYRVEVRTAADERSAFGACSVLHFRVLPPWWRTAAAMWLWAVLAAVAVGAAAFGYRMVVGRRMERRLREEKMLMRITELIDRCNAYERKNAAEEEPAAAEISADDRAFIDRAVALVEANISSRGYSVEQLGRDLCMERTGLYKRMTALLDKSPSAFIKSIRLAHAARLLCEGGHTVAEVADITGFSSSSYMSKCFVDTWGCTPLEYVRRNAGKST